MAIVASTTNAEQRPRLEALARSRTAPLREVQRARIVLAAAGASNTAIARDLAIEETTVRTRRGPDTHLRTDDGRPPKAA
jgi:DNA-binding NarL/FixJ family response regulator